ncbi:MAG: hypothetical protein K6C94_01310 [Candidatus Gastranaerophilales bacterium]|nr:hypothetical protein [Candidatus Gastranaerophilales bacterium]
MKWENKGLIYRPDGKNGWDDNTFIAPLPLQVDENTLRIYGTVRDKEGAGRLSYIEVDANNPKIIKKTIDKPLVDIGRPGMFDDNGVVAVGLLPLKDEIRIYYAGYTLGTKVRHFDFTGLAISKDGGLTFKKYSEIPICDRIEGEELTRAIQMVLYENGIYRAYYVGGSGFVQGKTKAISQYDLRYMESKDGIHFPNVVGKTVIPIEKGCYRVGKPYIVKENGIYKMFYSDGGDDGALYRLAYAESPDGLEWTKKDLNLPLSEKGWDSQMAEYPSFIRVNGKAYLFYNGNNYGYDGFGYAELIEE